jgi:hypothetical protein
MVAIKLSSLLTRPETPMGETDAIFPVIRHLVEKCLKFDLLVTIDAEETCYEPFFRAVSWQLMKRYNRERSIRPISAIYQTRSKK